MLFNSLLLLLTASTTTVFASSDDYAITGTMDKRRVSLSAGKLAKCVGGTINVSASATNIKLLIKSPADHYAATDIGVKMQQVGSNFTAHVTSGDANAVSGTFRIYSALCLPADAATASKVQTVQFLTHGATLDRNYWDIAHGYSYVDAAAQAGYATFSYDRLGTGLSDHPDPIQVVQTAIQVEIAHQLVNLLRTSTELGRSFRRVVGVGHSAGSVISQGVTTRYPNDFDALILTGTSTSLTSINAATASFDLAPAALDPSGRFEGLDYAYQTQAAVPQALQFAFFSHPFFEPKIFDRFVDLKQTNTLGELFTLGSALVPSTEFTGPVDVVNGLNDFVFCGGDCSYPTNQARPVIDTFYPAAAKTSTTFLQPESGHLLAAHYKRQEGFQQMLSFLKSNGV